MHAADLLQIWVNPAKTSGAKPFGLTPSTVSVCQRINNPERETHGGPTQIRTAAAADMNGSTLQHAALHGVDERYTFATLGPSVG